VSISLSPFPPASLPLCLLIPAGPGAPEIARIADLFDACATYADLPLCAVIINDGNDADALERAGHARNIPTTVLPNARRGEGEWWSGGLCMAMVDALRWIARFRPCRGVLRLDSDALVINPFAAQIAGFFETHPTIGILGNFDSASGLPCPPGHIVSTRLYWRSKRISHDRELKKLIFSFWGWRRRIRRLINRATRNGYVLGDWCQGGAYALSPEFLRRLAADADFTRPRDFLPIDFCEDVLLTLITHAMHLSVHYNSGPTGLFVSKWKGLRAAPEVLAASHHAIIHSVKDHEGRTESATREFFRQRRAGWTAPPAARGAAPGPPAPAGGAPALPLCVLVPLGPGPRELERLDDLMSSCLAYRDRPLNFVVVNDGNDASAIARLGARHDATTDVRLNPRQGRGNGWMGGLAMGQLDALLWLARNRPCCGVLKVDTDALVINLYADQIADVFARDPAIGILGNFDSDDGHPNPPGHAVTTMLYWRSKWVSHDRERRRFIFAFWGWRRRIRHLIARARGNGYALGDWCQGGSYALSPAFLARLAADPAFARPRDFLRIDFCEDVLMALIAYALDLRIQFTTGPARLFASHWIGLIAPPESLALAGHGIIHSVKDHAGRSEAETRSFFRARRQALRLDPIPGGSRSGLVYP
jgi:hypothetical protein